MTTTVRLAGVILIGCLCGVESLDAQSVQLGGTVGLAIAGANGRTDPDFHDNGIVTGVGVEAAWLPTAFGFFAEYSHLRSSDGTSPRRVNLYGAGMRVQERIPGTSRTWFFLDAGLGGGRWQLADYYRGRGWQPSEAVNGFGVILGIGVVIPIGPVYIRPQSRTYLMGKCCPYPSSAAGGSLAVGISF